MLALNATTSLLSLITSLELHPSPIQLYLLTKTRSWYKALEKKSIIQTWFQSKVCHQREKRKGLEYLTLGSTSSV